MRDVGVSMHEKQRFSVHYVVFFYYFATRFGLRRECFAPSPAARYGR